MSQPTSIENKVVLAQELPNLFPHAEVIWSAIFDADEYYKGEQAENCSANNAVEVDVPAAEDSPN